MKSFTHTSTIVLLSTLALGALGCGSKSSKRSATTPPVLAADSSQQASFAAAAATDEPEAVTAWGEVQRTTGADGVERVAIATDDGQTFEVANADALSGAKDGDAVNVAGARLPAMSAAAGEALAVKRVVAGGPILATRPAPPVAAVTAAAPAPPVVLMASAAPAAASAAPAASAPAASPSNVVAPKPWALRHGMSSSVYQDQVEDLAGKGFRLQRVGAHGSKSNPRFTGIWIKDGKPWSAKHGLTSDGLQAAVVAAAKDGYRPESVAQYGIWPGERYAVAFVKDGKAWNMRHRLSSSQYQDAFVSFDKDGYRPLWVTSTGLLGSERYAAIWIKDGKGTIARHRLTKGQLESRLTDYDAKGWRLACVSEHGTPGAYRYAAVWERDAAPGAVTNLVFHRQSSSTYSSIANHLAGDGFVPACVIQVGRASKPRFTHMWRRPAGTWVFRKTGFGSLPAVDAAVEGYMRDRKVTHLTLCVAKQGQVVLNRGYTYGPTTTRRTQPTSRLRIASISKPMTAIAILRLVQQGKLELSDTIGEHLPKLTRFAKDSRFRQVTIRQLLQHRGGWAISEKRDANDTLVFPGLGFDPMFSDRRVSLAFLEPMPIEADDVIRYMVRRQRLQFAPGSNYSYSNFGYNVLGRILEKVTGQSYEAHMRSSVFLPVGASSFRVGRAPLHQRIPGEVFYNDVEGRFSSDKHGSGELVPSQYGGWNLENMDAHGALVCTARDLVRVTLAVQSGQLLNANNRAQMWTPQTATQNYGLGWALSGGTLPNHNGSLTGTRTYLRVRPQGVVYSVLTNQRTGGDASIFAYAKTGSSIAARLDAALK